MALGDIVKGAFEGLHIGQSIEKVVDRLVPDPKLAADLKLALMAETNRHDEAVDAAAERAADQVTERAAELEGTASDLKAIPILGPLMLFLRGSQRVAWGFGVLFMDWSIFIAGHSLPDSEIIQQAFWIVNLLVLGFLFGERAVANILPLLTQFMQAKAAKT